MKNFYFLIYFNYIGFWRYFKVFQRSGDENAASSVCKRDFKKNDRWKSCSSYWNRKAPKFNFWIKLLIIELYFLARIVHFYPREQKKKWTRSHVNYHPRRSRELLSQLGEIAFFFDYSAGRKKCFRPARKKNKVKDI